ncbi:MAG TPA: HU family DNA-binding protein [Longimicrobiaceae bacterium]|nr:HU family DNA-binding protein [Longimicrobiaceae bacterium]
MNKTDLANHLADAHDLTKSKAKEIVNDVFDRITHSLKSGEAVAIDGFGRFKPNSRAARKGRNPQTGKTIDIPASKGAGFTAAKGLKDTLNG